MGEMDVLGLMHEIQKLKTERDRILKSYERMSEILILAVAAIDSDDRAEKYKIKERILELLNPAVK